MATEWVGQGMSEDMDVLCPKCGTKNTVKWFPPKRMAYRKQGTTGGSGLASTSRGEKVLGNCSECNYKFKPDDLD